MPTYDLIYRGALHGAEAWAYSCAVTGSGTLSDAATAAADAGTAMFAATDFDDTFYTGITWVDILVNQIPDGGVGPVIDSQVIAFADAGAGTGASTPNQCAIVVSKQTGFAGSRNRGRMYLPPPGTSSLTSAGRLSATALTGLSNGITAWKNSLVGDGFTPVLVSPSQNANVVITTLRIGNVIDTMRSRRNSLVEAYTNISV